ncbi:MAG: carbohydrate-binding family 9-like protein, partial [Bifidobacteriaceae bacterium]|nr:carbohydrate-binding family 9-like protein [Bifidobacteriaceae bacterium]
MPSARVSVPRVGFRPPVYVCRRATKPFTADGRLDKDFWAEAELTDPFVDIEGEDRPAPRYATRAKLLWDDENLYIGAELRGPEIWATVTQRDAIIYDDNDFEVFLLHPDSGERQYYELEMNALNTVWDLLLTKPYRDGGMPVNGFDFHGLQTAVFVDGAVNDPTQRNRLWSAEVAIPFHSISECARRNRGPQAGEYFRMNFSRVHWDVDIADGAYRKRRDPESGRLLPENNWVWSPTGLVNIHYPELWGFVFFDGGAGGEPSPAPEIPPDER